jgi:hypothetical protein
MLATSVASGLLLFSAGAGAQTLGASIGAFGGTTFGTTAAAPTFGASLAVPLGDHVQIIGEAGRLTDIKASLLDTALDFTPLDVGMSAWYGEGGVRLSTSRRAMVRPYVEATAGVARLKPSVGVDGWIGAVTNTGLAFLGTTEPMVGAGGGIVLQPGPLSVDIGYRYKRILADRGLASAFALGDDGFTVNQVRIGLGIRF